GSVCLQPQADAQFIANRRPSRGIGVIDEVAALDVELEMLGKLAGMGHLVSHRVGVLLEGGVRGAFYPNRLFRLEAVAMDLLTWRRANQDDLQKRRCGCGLRGSHSPCSFRGRKGREAQPGGGRGISPRNGKSKRNGSQKKNAEAPSLPGANRVQS